MQLQTNCDGEAVPKRKRRMSRREWREKWLVMSEGSTLEACEIKQLMRGPKLLKSAMPRAILKDKYLQRPRSAESEFGLRWRGPDRNQLTGRKKEIKNFERGEPERKPDKYFFNSVQVDPVTTMLRVKKPELIFSGTALGHPSKEVTALTQQNSAAALRRRF